jgi:hypothetical protein
MLSTSDNLQEETEKTESAAFESLRPPFPPVKSLLWDGEHRFPNNVGSGELRHTKAWEIHPIKLIAER